MRAKLDLSERTYKCENCNLEIDRDLNTAMNLESVARSAQETLNGHRENVRHILLSMIREMQSSVKCQSGIIRPEALVGDDKIHEIV